MNSHDPNKRVREGLDLNVAAKTLATQSSLSIENMALTDASSAIADASSATADTYSRLPQSGDRPSVVRRMFRSIKALLQPVASRLREYMSRPVLNRLAIMEGRLLEMQHAIARVAASTERAEAAARRLTGDLQASASEMHTVASDVRVLKGDVRELRSDLRELASDARGLASDARGLASDARGLASDARELASDARELASDTRELASDTRGLASTREDPRQIDQMARIEQYAAAAARKVAVNCGADELLIRTAVGYVICPASDQALVAILLEAGELEPGTRILLQRLLRPGDVFVDVGANIGMHTIAAARAMQGRGRIIAFEPYEPVARMLARSVWINGFSDIVDIRQAAVSSEPGERTLHLGATSGHHSLYELALDAGSARVRVVRLDQELPVGTPVTLIKIDAEGAELDVLKSCESIVADNRDIGLIVELGMSHLARTAIGSSEWLRAFTGLGLEYQAIHPDSGELQQRSIEELEKMESVNLLFARPESAIWSRANSRP